MSTTSPSQQGVEGTDAQEVWIITEESVILVISTSLFGKICILPQRRHILCLLATFQRLVAQFVGSGGAPARAAGPVARTGRLRPGLRTGQPGGAAACAAGEPARSGFVAAFAARRVSPRGRDAGCFPCGGHSA